MFTAEKAAGYVVGKTMPGVPALLASAKSMLGPRSSSISSTYADIDTLSTRASIKHPVFQIAHQVTAAMDSDDSTTESSYMSEAYGTEEEDEENNAMPASDEMDYEHLQQIHLGSALHRSDAVSIIAAHSMSCLLLPTIHAAPGDCSSFSGPTQARLAHTGHDLLGDDERLCLQQKLATTGLTLLLEEQGSGSSSINSTPCTPPSTPLTLQQEVDYEQQQQRFMQELQLHAKTWQLLEEEALAPSMRQV